MENGSDENISASHYLFAFFTLIAALVFVGIGMFIGFSLWGNKNATQSNSDDITKQITPFPTDVLFGGSSQQAAAADTTNGWTLYSDVNFTIKYPTSWLLKRGFSTQNDIILYDPKSIKQSGQSRTPSVYVDILSVTASSQSAQQIVDNYKNQSQQKNVTVNSEQNPSFGTDQVLFDGGGSFGKNVLWSHDGMLANFNTSLQHLTDKTTENTIIQSFQFTPPSSPPQQPAQQAPQ